MHVWRSILLAIAVVFTRDLFLTAATLLERLKTLWERAEIWGCLTLPFVPFIGLLAGPRQGEPCALIFGGWGTVKHLAQHNYYVLARNYCLSWTRPKFLKMSPDLSPAFGS